MKKIAGVVGVLALSAAAFVFFRSDNDALTTDDTAATSNVKEEISGQEVSYAEFCDGMSSSCDVLGGFPAATILSSENKSEDVADSSTTKESEEEESSAGIQEQGVIKVSLGSGNTYYISPQGNDSASGKSEKEAWRSLAHVNRKQFSPGDNLLLEGGKVHAGYLHFEDCGTDAKPITVSSYGDGAATIRTATAHNTIQIRNCGNYRIHNLKLDGVNQTAAYNGIVFENTKTARTTFKNISITNNEIFGYKVRGVSIVSTESHQLSGFHDVRIESNEIHNIAQTGIASNGIARSSSSQDLPHANFTVRNNKIYEVQGAEWISEKHTGSAIILRRIKDSVIEKNEAYNNGGKSPHSSGGGIWAADCDGLIFQHNISHHNKSLTEIDGVGYDIDGGCSNTIMQYNLSYENKGSGFLIAQHADGIEMSNNHIRYNVSINDARDRRDTGAIRVWRDSGASPVKNQFIYNNTVCMSPNGFSATESVFMQRNGDPIESSIVANNIFYMTDASVRAVSQRVSPGDVKFINNLYYNKGASEPTFYRTGKTYASLGEWRDLTGNEQYQGKEYGIFADPEFANNSSSCNLSVKDLRVSLGSPAVDSSLELSSITGTGSLKDYFGLHLRKGSRDIGAIDVNR